ncbi:MAG: threonine ammonia-lyase [Planctomycetes bacterium]|nr:threonine ammonia-lyase [Planctomycetota bacterium]
MSPNFAQIALDEALERIRAAAERIRPHARRTPTVYSYTFSESSGSDVWLKLENLQRTGSFKLRGALNKILLLEPSERARGLVAASAGNHAQGVALAARISGASATIVMPRGTPLNKVQRTEGYGAQVLLEGESYDESQAAATALAAARGATLVHPFDDPHVIEGQGTVALEILEEVPDLDTLVVPIGGGGLICGIALALKALAPQVRLVGVQASGAAPMVHSFASKQRETVDSPRTIADGIRVGAPGEHTLPLVLRLVDECVSVDEPEIAEAVFQTLEKSKLVAEPAGVVAIAALVAGKVCGAKKVCALVSGGNIDLNLLARFIENGLSNAGRYHLLKLRLADTPGELSRVLALLGSAHCNVLDVQHYRSGWKVPLGAVDVEILLETRRADHGREVERELAAHGFEVHA